VWTYDVGVIINSSIAFGGGRVYFVESRNPALKGQPSGQDSSSSYESGLWTTDLYLVALDADTGDKFWEKELKTVSGGHPVIKNGDVVFYLLYAEYANKEYLILESSYSNTNKFYLYTYEVEPADPQRLVPNPERKAMKKTLTRLQRDLAGLRNDYAQAALDNPEQKRRTMRGFKIANAALGKQIQALEAQCEETEAAYQALPKKVPIVEVLAGEPVVALEQERKTLTDLIKMVAYRAESAMLRLIEPLLKCHEDEDRAFLKALFQTPADLIPDENGKQLQIRFHSMANPRFNRVLCGISEALTLECHHYPGTDLRLVYEGPGLACETVTCQEV
jgi:hypothetical protein